MRYVLALVLMIAFLPVLSAIGANKGSRVDIGIKDGKFAPATANINVGDSIQWTNNDNGDHRIVADDGSFASGNLKPGDKFSKTFDKAGTYKFSCSLHPREKGTIVVR